MPLLKYAILLGLCTMLTSCSKDDSPSSNNVDADISGTYTLTGFNVSPAQDVNKDDTASTNLLDEMDCLSGTLTLNADTTWNLNITPVTVTSFTGGQFFIACDNAATSNGTWKITNGQLNLNGGSEPLVYFLNSNTLTRQISEDLPGFQSTVFTKQ